MALFLEPFTDFQNEFTVFFSDHVGHSLYKSGIQNVCFYFFQTQGFICDPLNVVSKNSSVRINTLLTFVPRSKQIFFHKLYLRLKPNFYLEKQFMIFIKV